MTKKLIVNADDLGMTLNVTRGIIKCHKNGIVTSASVMVNLPSSADSVQLVQKEAPQLHLGLHINLTTEQPLTDYPATLRTPDGRFLGKTAFLPSLEDGDLAAVQNEIHAQLEAFEALTGRQPDHLDSHHHITYVHPFLITTMLKLAERLQIPIRRPFTDLSDSLQSYLVKLNAQGNTTEIAEAIVDLLKTSNVAMPDYFHHSFFGDRTSLGDLLNDLTDVRDGLTELMCHPGIPDGALREVSGYVAPRQREMEALTHPTAREVIVASQITLATFDDLAI